MLYLHFTKEEIDKISHLLDHHSIGYEVTVNEELIEEQNERSKHTFDRYAQNRRSNTFYNILITKEEFARVPDDVRLQLERFNIYPEIADVVFEAEKEEIIYGPGNSKVSNKTRIPAILALLFLAFLGFMWVDEYVIRIFPGEESAYGDKRIFPGYLFEKPF
ncbi:MAG: hypothetical protein ACLGHN_15765 [Bacteriovoracia bacterium]